MKYEIGDLVRLKSGGPLMTVSKWGEYGNGPHCTCWWFNKDDIAHSESFHTETLTKGLAPTTPQE